MLPGMDTDLLSVSKAAKEANVSAQTIRNAYRDGLIDGVTVGRSPIFDRAQVEAFKKRRAARIMATAKAAAREAAK